MTMNIREAAFVSSNTRLSACPEPDYPEYSFIGRSNVGKSSLINMLTGRKGLAKTSATPGKTQLINHFIINQHSQPWYLVDLPGYGYAKSAKSLKQQWEKFVEKYLSGRKNLLCTFVLIDIRLEPQKADLAFMEWMAMKNLPFVIIFTKADKLKKNDIQKNTKNYRKVMLESWEEMPQSFISSSVNHSGREDILSFIAETNLLPFS